MYVVFYVSLSDLIPYLATGILCYLGGLSYSAIKFATVKTREEDF